MKQFAHIVEIVEALRNTKRRRELRSMVDGGAFIGEPDLKKIKVYFIS